MHEVPSDPLITSAPAIVEAAAELCAFVGDLLELDALTVDRTEALRELDLHGQRFQDEVFRINSARTIQCGAGCFACCTQWVHDVYGFEIERLGVRLLRQNRGRIRLAQLEERVADFDGQAKILELSGVRDPEELEIQSTRRWMKQERLCTFQDGLGNCGAHDERPWTCRRYFSLSDPILCLGAHLDSPFRRGFFLEPAVGFDELLARLDRHWGFDGHPRELDRGLRDWLRLRLI